MALTRRHGWTLLTIAAWNVFIWLTFARNLRAAYVDGEDRATGYWVAHTVLIVVGLVIAVVLTRIGLAVLRTTTRDSSPPEVALRAGSGETAPTDQP